MIMRKFYQNKLWRSKLADIKEKDGAIVHFVPLIDDEYGDELALKLIEEASEVYEAESQDIMKEEIVDILEAIDCLLALHNISHDEIAALKEKKLIEFGSYTNRKLVEYVEYPDGSKEALDCLENSEKYPELFEDENNELTIEDACCSDDEECSQ
jgi:predicted house-cleaning noncanonical NTP pyrophosphatase (MazG superfamily)